MNYTAIEALSTAVSAALAIAGVIAAWVIAKRAEQINDATRRISSLTALQDWRRDIRAWFERVVHEIIVIENRVVQSPDEVFDATELSALLECGRMFLPNQDRDSYGVDKLPAYRGFRHAALDPVAAAIALASKGRSLGKYKSRREALIDMRRHFVSRIQPILAPDDQNAEIARIIRETARSRDQTTGGLLPSDTEIPGGVDALLAGVPTLPRARVNDPIHR